MNLLKNIDFLDFYFNGHYLSEYGGIVGGTEPLKQYPLLPTRVYVTDRAANQDGVYVFNSYLEPRIFEVPVFFEDIDSVGLRKISAWLNSENDTWFYFKGDDLKIKCSIDGEYLLDTITGDNGVVYLKFIAHDPYYYALDEDEISYTGLSGSTHEFLFVNSGNQPCFPQMRIMSSGDITVSVLSENKTNVITQCTISDVVNAVNLDSVNCNCLSGSGANWFDLFDGDFPVFPDGSSILRIDGLVNRVDITPNYRWI